MFTRLNASRLFRCPGMQKHGTRIAFREVLLNCLLLNQLSMAPTQTHGILIVFNEYMRKRRIRRAEDAARLRNVRRKWWERRERENRMYQRRRRQRTANLLKLTATRSFIFMAIMLLSQAEHADRIRRRSIWIKTRIADVWDNVPYWTMNLISRRHCSHVNWQSGNFSWSCFWMSLKTGWFLVAPSSKVWTFSWPQMPIYVKRQG